MAEKICTRCGSTFTAKGPGKHKFCEPCKIRVCPFCNQEFRVTPQQDKQRFCSHACRSAESQSRNVEKFWEKVDKSSDCWFWTGSTNYAGYGVFYPKKGMEILAHRFAYEIEHGPIPDGLCILHKCDRPRCTRISHLFIGSREDNIRDMIDKRRNRHPSGEWHPHAKLDEETARSIRRAYDNGKRNVDIAREHGIDISTVSKIGLRKSWRYLDD